MITLTYIHNHECSRKGEEWVHRPYTNDGVYFRPAPICAETKTELRLVGEGERVDG